MQQKQSYLSIRIDEETMKKFSHLARYEDRTPASQIMHLMRKCIREFEKEHGNIKWEVEREDQD